MSLWIFLGDTKTLSFLSSWDWTPKLGSNAVRVSDERPSGENEFREMWSRLIFDKRNFRIATAAFQKPYRQKSVLVSCISALFLFWEAIVLYLFPFKNKANKMLMLTEFCSFTGVRRKRMKGDTWAYKKVCEELLSSAKLWKFTWTARDMCVLMIQLERHPEVNVDWKWHRSFVEIRDLVQQWLTGLANSSLSTK